MVYVPAVFFIILLVAGLVVAVLSLRDVPEESWSGMTEPHALLGGESTQRFTTNLNTHFLLSKPFSRIERAVNWGLAGDAGPSVRTGCANWFFLSEELDSFADAAQSAQARAQITSAMSRKLQASGIHLMVALVPDKSRIEQAQLCGLHRPAAFVSRLDNWQAQLRQAGVDVLSLEPTLQALPGARYYQTDSHWNEQGAYASAAAIVAHLINNKRLPAPATPPSAAALQRQTIARPGDLLRVSNLDGVPAWMRPATEQAQLTTIAAPSAPASTAPAQDDLFDDAGLPPLAVVGTSFSRTSNFVPFLSHQLSAPVANLAKDGGNFEGAALAYFNSKTFTQSPPKVVLWEVPERMLQKPLTSAERKWLAELTASTHPGSTGR
jgi:alginate O-acetyltransferase complex protein AlgJ